MPKVDTNLKLCASHGIATYEQLVKLKEAGISMYHHNIETSSDNYDNICTTHSYEQRIETVKNCQKAGLEICCGGILGLGESKEDRVKMAFAIKALGITSIPLNVLMPIKGTPCEDLEVLSPLEIIKSMALFRYIIPIAYIRYAGGRMALKDKQGLGFKSGVNAALVGNFLTTIGSNVENDKDLNLPVVIVARAGVGTINHTVLTVNFLRSLGIEIAGLIINKYTGSYYEDDNIKVIKRVTGLKIISVINKIEFNEEDFILRARKEFDNSIDINKL